MEEQLKTAFENLMNILKPISEYNGMLREEKLQLMAENQILMEAIRERKKNPGDLYSSD